MNGGSADTLVRLRRIQRWSLLAGVAATAVFIVGGIFDPAQFFRAYLSSYVFFFGIAMGSMALLMIYHLTGGAWGFLIRRFLERAVNTLPLVAVAFVPVALGVEYLYPFAQADVVADNELLEFQRAYLNPQLFWARAALFFVVWLALAAALLAWSRAQDRTGNARYARWCENLSGPGLVIYGVTMHFASIDWLMSLQPSFHSTIFGPLVVSGQILSAEALAVVMLTLVRHQARLAERVSSKALNDLGNLLLSFLVIWAYLAWFQYMLIWMANLPVDAVWYMPRQHGGWQGVTLAIVFLSLAAFLLLLWRAAKRSAWFLAAIAIVLLVVQFVFAIYLVAPPFYADRFGQRWMEFVAPIALGGIWWAFFLGRIGHWPLAARHDANEASALQLRLSEKREAAWEEVFSHG